jgi:nitroreductase
VVITGLVTCWTTGFWFPARPEIIFVFSMSKQAVGPTSLVPVGNGLLLWAKEAGACTCIGSLAYAVHLDL